MYTKILKTTNFWMSVPWRTRKNDCNGLKRKLPYNAEATAWQKKISDTRWCTLLKCWYVPYTKVAFEQFQQ
ncbi:MAG: hypothetical protein AUK44_10750 [Porphyromonadaceae bacterium CG2_30_38_12]|nr:MAG: hypothetical protein AUK44_10750 [Porphyromonadaceae bacterium CG2_30_38_12]